MEALWFWLVAFMLTAYVILDGFDLGAGALHLLVARNDAERNQILASVGPVWDGNEVWLIAGGGVLYFAFPKLYASGFSGFYLPLMIVLWLLILRALAIEFRNLVRDPAWVPFWDVALWGASLLLTIFFGCALGNVVRGVPMDASGVFFLPLWTNWRLGSEVGILDWYTVLVGLFAAATLIQHGALWLNYKLAGPVQERALRIARKIWYLVVVLLIAVTLASFAIQPQLRARLEAYPLGYLLPILALIALASVFVFTRTPQRELHAFLSSCLFIGAMMLNVAHGLFPYVLPAYRQPDAGLTIYNSAAPEHGLRIGLAWWIPGIVLTIGYFVYTYRRLRGKIQPGATGH